MLRDRRGLRAGSCRTCSRSRCGAARRSTRRCASSRNPPGSGWPSCASGSRTSSSRCCCGPRTPSATRTIPTTSSRRSSRSRPQAGIDLFRIFDSLNWLPNLQRGDRGRARRPARSARRPSATPATSSIPNRPKYDLKYYVELAKELEKLGAHILAIKDMAGLCKPYAAEQLVKHAQAGDRHPDPLPHARHGRRAGRVRCSRRPRRASTSPTRAIAPLSGLTSPAEPERAWSRRCASRRATPASTSPRSARLADYWAGGPRVSTRRSRPAMLAADADVYLHEMPGGQYTNLYAAGPGARAWTSRWPEVCRMYAEVNQLFGDIIKVTPTSKVGRRHGPVPGRQQPERRRRCSIASRELAFPESVVEFFEGGLGQPPGGFPPELQKRVLRGRKPLDGRPGASAAAGRFRRDRREGARSCSAASRATATSSPTCSIRASSPTSPRTSRRIPTRACCRRRSSSTAWSRARN